LDEKFSEVVLCRHCGNSAPMPEVGSHSQVVTHLFDDGDGPAVDWEEGPIYQLLKCSACASITLRCGHYHSAFDDEFEFEVIYLDEPRIPKGLPEDIEIAWKIALKIKAMDANLFSVQLGKVLEHVAIDRGAAGKNLHDKLKSLADRGEIPQRLSDLAGALRKFRNLGAHVDPAGDLSDEEAAVLEDNCVAVLEYIYTAPTLLERAQKRMERFKGARA
jgi:hypothetical protein